jgi:hypothetical protein
MRHEHHEDSDTFWKPTTWEAVRASDIHLITHSGVDFARLALRVTCSLRLAENEYSKPCVRLDHFIEALWSPSGDEPRWNDITSRSLNPDGDGAACALFAETEEEALTIDACIEGLLGAIARGTPPASPGSKTGGGS